MKGFMFGIITLHNIHRIKYTHRRGKIDKDRETRAMLSDRFKSMYRQMGLDRPAAAKLLRVSERTLHNWETGVHEIPYSAYKLLRLLSYTELPGAWSGWHIAVGRLWSPEGHAFKPADSSWWSLLCRRAAGFDALYKENARLRLRAEGPKGELVQVTPHQTVIRGQEHQQTQQPRGFATSCANIKFRGLKFKVTHLISKGVK